MELVRVAFWARARVRKVRVARNVRVNILLFDVRTRVGDGGL